MLQGTGFAPANCAPQASTGSNRQRAESQSRPPLNKPLGYYSHETGPSKEKSSKTVETYPAHITAQWLDTPALPLRNTPPPPEALPLEGHVQQQPEVRETVRKTERPLRQPQVFGNGFRPTMEGYRRPPGKLAHDWTGMESSHTSPYLALPGQNPPQCPDGE